MLFYSVLFLILWTQISSFLDFYIDTNETKRLLGLEAELYYVRNGSLNTYATQFRVPIRSTLNDMRFTWQSRKITKNNEVPRTQDLPDCVSRPSSSLGYVITLLGIDPEVLQTPVTSIPMQGVVPTKTETFTIVVGCVPDVTAEIDFDIMFNITSCDAREATYLKLLRKKICVTDEAFGRLNHEDVLLMKKKINDFNGGSDDDPSVFNDAAATRRRGAAIISPNPSLSPLANGPEPTSGQTPAMGSMSRSSANTNTFAILMIGSAVALAILAGSGIAAYYHRFPAGPRPRASSPKMSPAPSRDHLRFYQQKQQRPQDCSSVDRSLAPSHKHTAGGASTSTCTSANASNSDYQRAHASYTAGCNGTKLCSGREPAAARKSLSLEAGTPTTNYTLRSSGRQNRCCMPPPGAPPPRARVLVHRDSSLGESDSHTPLLFHRTPHPYHNRPPPPHHVTTSDGTPSFYDRPVRGPPSHHPYHLSPVPAAGSDSLSPQDHHQIARGEDFQTAPIQSRYFAFQNIRLGNVMVEGTFGEIRHAFLHDAARKGSSYEMPIIVKMIKSAGLATASQVELMNRESALCAFKDLQHPNVLSLIGFSHHMTNEAGGAVPDHSMPILVYPHMTHGILKLFLLRCHHSETHIHQLSTKDMVNIAVQLLYGLQALHCNGLVHKDLATRNCYMTDNLTVKIGDTALSRDVFPADYCCLGDNENRPVKWMALESLFLKSFSFASDIWSFGVTLWELVTFAETPYADIDPFEIGSYLQHGFRLPQPQNCPDEIYSIILSCLASAPEERPHITLIISALLRFQKTLDRFI